MYVPFSLFPSSAGQHLNMVMCASVDHVHENIYGHGRATRRKEPGRLTDCKEHCSPAKLGSTLTSKLSCEKEINMRKGQFVPLYFLVSVKTASPFPSLIYSHQDLKKGYCLRASINSGDEQSILHSVLSEILFL